MKTLHTPGPWFQRNETIWNQDMTKAIAIVSDYHSGEQEREANTKLIAAAPALLKVVLQCQEAISNYHPTGFTAEQVLDSIIGLLDDQELVKLTKSLQLPVEKYIHLKSWPKSKTISATEYNSEHHFLDVTYKNNKQYRYYDVPESEWTELIESDSIGSFVRKRIHSSYNSRAIDGPATPFKNPFINNYI